MRISLTIAGFVVLIAVPAIVPAATITVNSTADNTTAATVDARCARRSPT